VLLRADYSPSDLHSFLLVRHPRAMEKLRAEIAAASVACSIITRDALKNMPYLQNVLRESGLHCSGA
jgi:histidinol-phosphate/aromatic aminotransferase/cobyric acid decarboxylase-like protein